MLSDIFFHQTVTYTRTEQEIIDFICKNPGVFLTASISQLADRLGISDASLSRLAKHAGYPDYKGRRDRSAQRGGARPKAAGLPSEPEGGRAGRLSFPAAGMSAENAGAD